MKIGKRVNQYRKNGAIVFVHEFEGSDKEVKDYIKSKADAGFDVVDPASKKPLFWCANVVSEGTPITLTTNGKYVTGDLEAEAVDIAAAANAFKGKVAGVAAVLGISNREAVKMMLGVQ
jgi:hypothetical protein